MSNGKVHDLNWAEQLLDEGKFREALQIVETIEQRDALSTHNHLLCQVLKSNLMNKMGHFDRALKLTEQILEEIQDRKLHLLKIDALIVKAEGLWHLGRLDNSLVAISQGEKIIKSLEQSSDVILRIARLEISKAEIYWAQGKQDRALEFLEQSLFLGRKINKKDLIIISLCNLGAIYLTKGDLDYALKYFQDSLMLLEDFENKHLRAGVFINIGNVCAAKGELDRALDYLQESLLLFEELGNKHLIAGTFRTIGSIYGRKGDLDQALNYLKQSVDLFKEIGNKMYLSGALFSLISVAIDRMSPEQTQYYLKQLEEINIQEDSKLISQFYRVAEALLLKTRPRTRNRIKAAELLEQVVKEDVVNHEVTVVALLNLCDLLLGELRLSGDPEVLDEVQNLVNRLFNIAKKQHSHSLLVETYLLQSKLALVNLNLEKTQRLLIQAQELAEEKGLQRLAIKVSYEHDELLRQLDKWKTLIQQKASISERIDLVQIEELLEQMIQKKTFKIPSLVAEDPVMALILDRGGITLFSKVFSSGSKFEEQLMGGFLMAIQSFSTQVFAQAVDRVKFEDYTLLMRAEEPFLVCYIFQGSSYFAQQKLSQFIHLLRNNDFVWQALVQVTSKGRLLSASDHILIEDMLTTAFKSRDEEKFKY
ncbi:MAG: tetratricopeptide repeat protein [Candidatus Hodarchaeota archaeon]